MSWNKEKINYETYEKPSDFMTFKQGDNAIRIVSDGFITRKHQFRTGGRFVSMDCVGSNCDQCKAGVDTKIRYVWIILDKDANKVKVLECGRTLGHDITILGKREDIRTFDLIVTRRGADKTTTYKVKRGEGGILPPEEKQLVMEYLPKLQEQYL